MCAYSVYVSIACPLSLMKRTCRCLCCNPKASNPTHAHVPIKCLQGAPAPRVNCIPVCCMQRPWHSLATISMCMLAIEVVANEPPSNEHHTKHRVFEGARLICAHLYGHHDAGGHGTNAHITHACMFAHLYGHHDAGGDVGDAHGAVGRVHVLPARRAARPVGVDAQVLVADDYVHLRAHAPD